MAAGLLEVTGTIDIDQFWPRGMSDADTTKLKVEVGQNAFRFRPSPGGAFRVTHAFDDAVVLGQVRKPAIDKQDRVTIRLQGIDAPELHYRPQALVKKADRTGPQADLWTKWDRDYRQRYGETATVALSVFLEQAGQNPLPCKVVTQVDSPNDVFDTYGRMVADILVKVDGALVNVNHWLAENGWALPTFYNSMTEEEIAGLLALTKSARSKKRGVWPDFTLDIPDFDPDLVFRKKGSVPDPAADQGPLILPKLFRRQATYEANKRSKMTIGTFDKYLQQHRDANSLHLMDDFLEQGAHAAPVHYLDQYLEGGRFQLEPADMVFRESPSKVRGPNGQAVVW